MAQVAPEGAGPGGKTFAEGGDLDISQGPVQKRRITNPEWCILFLVHIGFFWICAFQGAADGNPWKLVNPRDYRGQYCGVKEQWNDGTDMTKFEKGLYTLNLTATVDPLARSFICSTAMKSALTSASVVTDAEYTSACGSSLSANSLSALTANVPSTDSASANLLTGSGGTSILSAVTKYFNTVCAKSCKLSSSDATEKITYTPAPYESYYSIWNKMVAYCSGTGSGSTACQLDKFKFNALPASECPYADRQKCVVISGISFTELASGYCTIKISGDLSSASKYLDDLAKTGVVSEISGGFDSALGDIQSTWDVFILISILSLVCGLVYLVLLRFLVKPVVWGSIVLILVIFVVAGVVSILYSGMCKDSAVEETAKKYAGSGTNTTAATECGGQYKIQDETNRDILLGVGYALLCIGALYLLLICCLFKRIRLAIAINEVAAMFVYNTPHIIFVPIVQALIAIFWCAIWMLIASFLLSQVPKDYVPTGALESYTVAMGTEDKEGKCNDAWPSGYAYQDLTSADCISNQKCWKCAPPRYIFDYRFAFSFFSFLWHNAFFVACGQCIIAGAVGLWFFKARSPEAKDLDPKASSRMAVCRSVKNALVYHPGSLAFGSFILAIVQFLRYLMYYISKQAKAQKNVILEVFAKIAGCCLWCFEKCVKFLNKNAYIQIALMSTPFCVSAKNAFWLILRNVARFGVIATLGSVVRFIGMGFVMASTGMLGFLLLDAMHPDIDTPVILVILYIIIGYFVGALFMNVFGLAVDSTLQCFIAAEEMGINNDFIPEKLRAFVDETSASSQGADKGCCSC